jgi:hypothetical protein
MSRHEQYEELCTLAMIGEVSPAEMQDLRQHLSECSACREQYYEFTQFLLPQLSISSENDASFETGYSTVDRARLRSEFLVGAQKRGRVFSQEAIRGSAKEGSASAATPGTPPPPSIRAPRIPYRWAVAASIISLVFLGGYATHVAVSRRARALAHGAGSVPAAMKSSDQIHPQVSAADDSLAILRTKEEADTKTIASLQQELSKTLTALQKEQNSRQAFQIAQSALQRQLDDKNAQITTLMLQSQGNEQNVSNLRLQVAQLQERMTDGQVALSASQLRVRELNDQLSEQTASLDREREMLSVGKDVRDLMGARNLHIIDVHDANGAGKDRKSFGRIFYTEGKSLIFYAFDLDDKRVVNANYSYEAWGEQLGQPMSVKSLGVLYSDDKAQRRWSLKVDDPHQLAEVNSVFVTLEPHSREGDKPQGKRILYAFLGGEANHP